MAYKCLSLCGLLSFFKGFSENLFHAGFQLIQIEGRTLHGKTENFLLFRVGEIALIVLKHPLPCVLHHFSGCAQGFVDPHELVRDLISLELFRVGCGHRNRIVSVGFCVSSFHRFRDLRVHDLGKYVLPLVGTALHEFGHFIVGEFHFTGKDLFLDAGRKSIGNVNALGVVPCTKNRCTADTVFLCDTVAGFLAGVVGIIVICSL